MLKYLLVLLDNNATSFCYYKTLPFGNDEIISIDSLKQIVGYANRNALHINFLFGKKKIPQKYEKIIDTIVHTKIIPIDLITKYPSSIIVISSDDLGLISTLKNNIIQNIILRMEKSQLNKLSDIVKSLLNKCKRLNLMLLDIQDFTQYDYDLYYEQLLIIEKYIIDLYRSKQPIELNFISDRILLSEMNNCNAGVTHFTFAPNGKFYLCPAFCYANPEDSIGDLTNGIQVNNAHLLSLQYAPICRRCDAYHCKRCIYLNKLTTLELNTPSQQQCTISHLERNTSKNILELLKPEIAEFQNLQDIQALSYLDPFELVKNDRLSQLSDTYNSPEYQNLPDENIIRFENMTDREILFSIYQMQKEILLRFNNFNN